VSKMQRFGLIALLIAAVGVVLVVLFLPAGHAPGSNLVGLWSMEGPKQGDEGIRLILDKRGTCQLTRRERGLLVNDLGTWQASEVETNRIALVLSMEKTIVRDPQSGQQAEEPNKSTMKWTIEATDPDNLRVSVAAGEGQTHEFRLRRVQK
jgi:hypothetical protein